MSALRSPFLDASKQIALWNHATSCYPPNLGRRTCHLKLYSSAEDLCVVANVEGGRSHVGRTQKGG